MKIKEDPNIDSGEEILGRIAMSFCCCNVNCSDTIVVYFMVYSFTSQREEEENGDFLDCVCLDW